MSISLNEIDIYVDFSKTGANFIEFDSLLYMSIATFALIGLKSAEFQFEIKSTYVNLNRHIKVRYAQI